MHDIEMHEVSPEFALLWRCAGQHLQRQMQDGMRAWLRVHLAPPFLEHLSFRIGNQLFFVRIEDSDNRLEVPGSRCGLLSIADACKGHACVMPMKKQPLGSRWVPDCPDWGLIDARTKAPIDPHKLVTDEKIVMTDWELQDFAVQVVREQLQNEGYELMSWQGNPSVDPAIWFVGDSKKPEWIAVRAVRHPATYAERPDNWSDIAQNCERLSEIGHFASVAFASTENSGDPEVGGPGPLWRGHCIDASYDGLTNPLEDAKPK